MTVLRPRVIPFVLAFLTLPGLAAGQVQVTVAGRVVEFGTRTGIGAAGIVVPGVARVSAGPNGEFRIPRVPAGTHTLTVEARATRAGVSASTCAPIPYS